jgi:hypothetical protein
MLRDLRHPILAHGRTLEDLGVRRRPTGVERQGGGVVLPGPSGHLDGGEHSSHTPTSRNFTNRPGAGRTGWSTAVRFTSSPTTCPRTNPGGPDFFCWHIERASAFHADLLVLAQPSRTLVLEKSSAISWHAASLPRSQTWRGRFDATSAFTTKRRNQSAGAIATRRIALVVLQRVQSTRIT